MVSDICVDRAVVRGLGIFAADAESGVGIKIKSGDAWNTYIMRALRSTEQFAFKESRYKYSSHATLGIWSRACTIIVSNGWRSFLRNS